MFDKFSNEIYIRLSNAGKLPLCNQRADRAPKLFGFCFPLCWRCTSIYLGFGLLGPVVSKLFGYNSLTVVQNNLLIIILTIPVLIDGGNQYYFQKKESTNSKRIITGGLAGIAIYLLMISLKLF